MKQAAVINVGPAAHRTPKHPRTGIERAMYAIPQDINILAGSAALDAACDSQAMIGKFAGDLPIRRVVKYTLEMKKCKRILCIL